MYIPTKYGRILYVSKEGNNSSAEVGNPSRPWETPQDARDASSNGDLIYVFPGTYTYGNSDSGADYVGTTSGGTYDSQMEVCLNYGISDINYYFQPGVLMQGISGAAVPRALLYEPYGVNPETASSTVNVYGHMDFTSTGDFIQGNNRDSKWYVEFNEVLSCTVGLRIECNFGSVGGVHDTTWMERFVVRGKKITSTSNAYRIGFEGNVSGPSDGRMSLTRGYINIEVDEIYSSGVNSIRALMGYDMFMKVNKLVNTDSFNYVHTIRDSIIHLEFGEITVSGENNACMEDMCVMVDAELHFKASKLRSSSATGLAALLIRNDDGAGGKLFIDVEDATINSAGPASSGTIRIQQFATASARASYHATGGNAFEGETVAVISGNFTELNSSVSVMDTLGTAFASGVSGNILPVLKNCKLIGSGTNSITAPAGANTDYLIQGCYANLPVHANVDEVGQAVIVDSNYK